MTRESLHVGVWCALVATAVASSGCAVYWKGGVHAHWVPTADSKPGVCERLPEVHRTGAPTEPYYSIGIIQVLSIAKGNYFGVVIKPDWKEIASALRKRGCELGCDVLVERPF